MTILRGTAKLFKAITVTPVEKTRQVEAHRDAVACDAEHRLALRLRDVIVGVLAPVFAMVGR